MTSNSSSTPFTPDSAALYFLPLGGAGEIGMNFSLYGFAGKWLAVDLGIAFGDETMPGIDVVMPDPAFIAERKRDIAGLVITHGHEDHLGAVAYLWDQLECPIYATPFTAALVRNKLMERGLLGRAKLVVVPPSGSFTAGPFTVDMVGVTHSIPEAHSLIIRTPVATIVHTGDWKLDPNPMVGPATDTTVFEKVGLSGVDVLVCDSTNAMVPGRAGSEAQVREGLIALFGRFTQRIAVTCFASNVARMDSIAAAAAAVGRDVALVGRSLWRMDEAARATGYLAHLPPFLTEAEAVELPPDRVVLICTGSQGEPRSALARIANDDHPEVVLDPGDVVVYSSREIPGNEKAIARVQNQLTHHGIEVVTSADAFVHVSGHPAQDELTDLYGWLRPRKAVPVHGEERHLSEHAALARRCGVTDVHIPANGEIIRLAPGPLQVVGEAHHGRLALDGKRIVPLNTEAMRTRTRMAFSGAAVAALVVNRRGDIVGEPMVATMGVFVDGESPNLVADLSAAVRLAVESLSLDQRLDDDDAVREAARLAVRRHLGSSQGKKPMTEVQLMRV